MAVNRIEDLLAFQLAQDYKRAVYALVDAHQRARHDFRFTSQLQDAASGVEACLTEGFHRRSPGELRQFVRYALASLAESQFRIRDGVDRGHYQLSDCTAALTLGGRCRTVTSRFLESLPRGKAKTLTRAPEGRNTAKIPRGDEPDTGA